MRVCFFYRLRITRIVNCPSFASKEYMPLWRSTMLLMLFTPSPWKGRSDTGRPSSISTSPVYEFFIEMSILDLWVLKSISTHLFSFSHRDAALIAFSIPFDKRVHSSVSERVSTSGIFTLVSNRIPDFWAREP